jgi:hypothetical protein
MKEDKTDIEQIGILITGEKKKKKEKKKIIGLKPNLLEISLVKLQNIKIGT